MERGPGRSGAALLQTQETVIQAECGNAGADQYGDEDQLLAVDTVDESIARAIEDYYASRGYYVAIELA